MGLRRKFANLTRAALLVVCCRKTGPPLVLKSQLPINRLIRHWLRQSPAGLPGLDLHVCEAFGEISGRLDWRHDLIKQMSDFRRVGNYGLVV